MHPVLYILAFKLRGFLKFNLEQKIVNLVRHAASVIVFGGFSLGSYAFAHASTMYLLDTAHLGLFLLHRFISMLLFVFFLSVNVGNLIVSYATFYRSPETAYLLTKPLAHTHLFLVKFLDNFFYSSTALFLIASSVLLGYGSYFHMPWTFYLQTMFLMFIPFMLISACLAVMLLLVLMRYASRVGVRKMIGGLVVVYLGSLSLYFRMTNPMELVRSVTHDLTRVNEYLGYLDPPLAKFFPNQWIAESLFWTMKGDVSYATSYTIILLVVTALILTAMLLVARRSFYASWLVSLELRSGSNPGSFSTGLFSLTSPSRFDAPTTVLIKKEFLQFIREPSQWIHLAVISVLICTFMVSVSEIDLSLRLPFLQTVSFMVILAFGAFLIVSIALRFVYPMFSIEGESFWSVLSAPVSRRKIFRTKFLVAFVPLCLLSMILTAFCQQPLRHFPLLTYLSLIMMLGVSFAMAGLNLGAGLFFVNYKERNPIRAASSQSATLTFLLGMLYLTVIVAVMFVPLNRYFEYVFHGTLFEQMFIMMGVIVVLIISIIIGSVSLLIGMRALRRDY